MKQKFKRNIRINKPQFFKVKLRVRKKGGLFFDKELFVEANNAIVAGHEAERMIRKDSKVKSVKWLFVVDDDGAIHY